MWDLISIILIFKILLHCLIHLMFSLQDKIMIVQVKIKPINQVLRCIWKFRVVLMTLSIKGRNEKKEKSWISTLTRYISYMARKWYLHKRNNGTVKVYVVDICCMYKLSELIILHNLEKLCILIYDRISVLFKEQ